MAEINQWYLWYVAKNSAFKKDYFSSFFWLNQRFRGTLSPVYEVMSKNEDISGHFEEYESVLDKLVDNTVQWFWKS